MMNFKLHFIHIFLGIIILFIPHPIQASDEDTLCFSSVIAKLITTSTKTSFNQPFQKSPAQIAKIKAIWENPKLDMKSRHQEVVQVLIEYQMQHSSKKVRKKMQVTLNDIYQKFAGLQSDEKIIYAHYLPKENLVKVADGELKSTIGLVELVHELIGHSFDLNQNPFKLFMYNILPDFEKIISGTKISPRILFELEGHAIGAQWELVQNMNKNLRINLIEKLKLNQLDKASNDKSNPSLMVALRRLKLFQSDPERYLKIEAAWKGDRIDMDDLYQQVNNIKNDYTDSYIATLENAGLNKKNFIKKLRPLHGYDLKSIISKFDSDLAKFKWARVILKVEIFSFISAIAYSIINKKDKDENKNNNLLFDLINDLTKYLSILLSESTFL